ncbi:MAG: fibronectin type III domain-containing protein [Candidatus Dojkabacteria bacterium]|nr:fibronectin type III domain-containing protein [Candidatus Dojkabacteria bacterium]
MKKLKNRKVFLVGLGLIFLLGLISIVIVNLVEKRPTVSKLRVTNVTGTSATVSWISEEPMKASVIYGEEDKWMPVLGFIGKGRAYDDRDVEEVEQGEYEVKEKGEYYTHHVTLRNLNENRRYFYRISTGVKTIEVKEAPLLQTTYIAEEIKIPSPVYGLVTEGSNRRVDDSIVYLRMENKKGGKSAYLSTYTNEEGGWSLDISNAREESLEKEFDADKRVKEEIEIEGGVLGSRQIEAEPGGDQPVETVKLEGKKEIEDNNAGLDRLITGAYAAQTSPKENACGGQDYWEECYDEGFDNPCCGSSGTCYEAGMYGVNGYWFCRGQGEWLGWCDEYYCEDQCSESGCTDKIIYPEELPDEGEVVYNPSSLDFGTIEVGGVSSKVVQMSNNTSQEISIKDCPEAGPFSAMCPGSISSNDTREITVGVGYTDYPGDYDETLKIRYNRGSDEIKIDIKAKVKIVEPQASFPGCPPPSFSDLDTYLHKDGGDACTWQEGKFHWDADKQICYKNYGKWDVSKPAGEEWTLSSIKVSCSNADHCKEPSFGVLSCEPPGCTPDCSGKECGSDGCSGTCSPGCQNSHGTSTCSEFGRCGVSCTEGWADCDGVRTNGCETELRTMSNCGYCQDACITDQMCIDGMCTIPECRFDSDCYDGNSCTNDFCDTSSTKPKCKYSNLSDGTTCSGCAEASCICSVGTCVPEGTYSHETHSLNAEWFMTIDTDELAAIREYSSWISLVYFPDAERFYCEGTPGPAESISGIESYAKRVKIPAGEKYAGGTVSFNGVSPGCYLVRSGDMTCDDTGGIYKTNTNISDFIWLDTDSNVTLYEIAVNACRPRLPVGNVDTEWIKGFNNRNSFNLAYDPFTDLEKEAFVELQNWILNYDNFNSVTKDKYFSRKNLREGNWCGNPGAALACIRPLFPEIYFDDEFLYSLVNRDGRDEYSAKRIFQSVMLHELMHEYDFDTFFELGAYGTLFRNIEGKNWYKSIGWRKENDPRIYTNEYCDNCGYETPVRDYGYKYSEEDIATSMESFYYENLVDPYFGSDLGTRRLRCCLLEEVVFEGRLNRECGDCPQDLSLKKLKDYYLAKDGKTWVEKDSLPPAGLGSLSDNLYANVLGGTTEDDLAPELVIDTYEDFTMDTPENNFVSSVKLSEKGLYEISVNGSSTNVKVTDDQGADIALYNDSNQNGEMDEGEETSVFRDDIQIKKVSDTLSYKLDKGWTLISLPFDTERGESVNSSSELLKEINDSGGLATHIATLREGQWLLYSERNGRSFGEDFKLHPAEGYFA